VVDEDARGLRIGPNPFNPEVEIRFTLETAGEVRIEVLDVGGRRIRVLAGDRRDAGTYSLDWDGRAESGSPIGSGAYFLRVQRGNAVDTRKLLIVK
jgi:flagellar hook assembly protein FlgD